MESPTGTPIGQQATILGLMVQTTLRDTQGGQSLSLGFPSRPSFLVQKGTKHPSKGCANKMCSAQTLPPGPGQRPWGREGSQSCHRKSCQFGAESQIGVRGERVLTISCLQLSHCHDHYFGST